MSDGNLFHEIELFPAALIRKCLPIHITALHDGKINVTGMKYVEQFYDAMCTVIPFLESTDICDYEGLVLKDLATKHIHLKQLKQLRTKVSLS